MNPPIPVGRQPLPTILSVYSPIEEYRESAGSTRAVGPGSSDSLDPLDTLLVHRLLDLVSGEPVLIDEAMVATGGASSLIGLNHPRVRGVWALADRDVPGCHEALSALRGHLSRRAPVPAPLAVVSRAELPADLLDRPGIVVLTHAGVVGAGILAEEAGRWLGRRPDALFLVLGLGKVGYCPALASLMHGCTAESGMQFELLRELSEVLIASRLGVVYRRDRPEIPEALRRLRLSYSGNYGYLDLLRQCNDAALREARIDDDTLRGNWTFGPLSEEIEALKQKARESDERASAALMALREARERPSAVSRIRRRLSSTPVGGAWRLAKRSLGVYLGRGR